MGSPTGWSGCKRAMVGTQWANFCRGCTNMPTKCYSNLLEGSFLAGKAAWALRGYLPTEKADYCMLVNGRLGEGHESAY